MNPNTSANKVGDLASYINTDDGYNYVDIDGETYRADHLAFLHVKGCYPSHGVEHINGDRADDTWLNLKETQPNA